MLTGIYQSGAILAAIVVFYAVDSWLIRRYDSLRAAGSSRSWSYTLMAAIPVVLIIVQPTAWPGLGVYTDAWWGLLVQAVGLALLLGGLTLHWWARLHLGQFYGEREEVQTGQYLVQSGPYAYVRHPLYTSYFALALGLVLINPALSTLLAVAYAVVDFCLATRREEKLLIENLPGYDDYIARTPRFLPRLRRG